MELDECIGRNEPDPEIRALLLASVGLNLGLDYLPGATMFDPAARDIVDAKTASKGVWFDAFTTNIDRTARNTNLLWWHRQLYFIDHGASLYFHYDWRDAGLAAIKPFPAIKDHALLPWANQSGRSTESYALSSTIPRCDRSRRLFRKNGLRRGMVRRRSHPRWMATK